MNNRKRLKKLILANKETRWLYRMMQFLAIFMVVSCLVIFATAKWIEYDQNKKREEIFGSWDEVFLNVDQEDLNYFRKNAFLEKISVQSIKEKVFLEGDQRVIIGSCDGNFLEMGNIELLEGRMPEHEKEVTVEDEYLEVIGVSEIGDVVPNGSEVKSLIGYTVVGIVSDYSTYWKMINSEVKYINCFIKNGEYNSLYVFVKYKLNGLKDPEINMIYYKDNICLFRLDVGSIWKIVIVVLLINVMLLVCIKAKINKNAINSKKKNCKNKKHIIYLVIIIEIILSLATTELINVINIDYSPVLDEQLYEENFKPYVPYDNKKELLDFYWYDDYGELNQMKLYIYFILNHFIDKLYYILQILLFSSIQSFLISYILLRRMRTNYLKIFNVGYFYDMNPYHYYHILLFYLLLRFIISHLMYFNFIGKYSDAILNGQLYSYIFINLLTCLIIFLSVCVAIDKEKKKYNEKSHKVYINMR